MTRWFDCEELRGLVPSGDLPETGNCTGLVMRTMGGPSVIELGADEGAPGESTMSRCGAYHVNVALKRMHHHLAAHRRSGAV